MPDTGTSHIIKLVVGPGNPDVEYVATQHSAGFWLADQLVYMGNATLRNETCLHGYAARANLWGNEMWLLQPQTFMDHSGLATVVLARFHKVMLDEILVVHDELDLPPDTVKLKLGGGSGGHDGLKDIAAHPITQQFWRPHLGTGYPRNLLPPGTVASGQRDVANFVLKASCKEGQDLIGRAIDQSLDTLPELIAGDIERATMRLHTAH